jgi:GcrA cell cycle regulator
MNWTDERVSLLKRLWGEGHTATEIAKVLGGVSRNAVIGKVHRLKLSNRVSPIQQNKKPVTTTTIKTVSRKVERAPAPDASQNNVAPPEKRAEELLSLTDLKPRMCRWPVGDPREPGFGFCGDPSVGSLPYCTTHAKAAYQAATRNRILKIENLEGDQADNEAMQERASLKTVG